MRRSWVYIDGVAYERGREPSTVHHVMPDIEPFRSPDGALISGRRAWREHLARTDTVEMGHSDVKAAQATWETRKQAHQDRLRGAVAVSQDWSQPEGEIRPLQRSGLAVEMANRLHGRPVPERKEMLKLSLEQAKRMSRAR